MQLPIPYLHRAVPFRSHNQDNDMIPMIPTVPLATALHIRIAVSSCNLGFTFPAPTAINCNPPSPADQTALIVAESLHNLRTVADFCRPMDRTGKGWKPPGLAPHHHLFGGTVCLEHVTHWPVQFRSERFFSSDKCWGPSPFEKKSKCTRRYRTIRPV